MRPSAALRSLVERFDPSVFDAPAGRARLRLAVAGDPAWDAVFEGGRGALRLEPPHGEPDAELRADAPTWAAIERDLSAGLEACARGDLVLRRNLHLSIAFLAATSGEPEPGRLRFDTVRAPGRRFSLLEAGTGAPLVMLHGLGGTKASFLPTVAGLSGHYRTIAVDLPGFGDSGKPLGARYDPAFFADSVVSLLDALGLERVHLLGHSLGGRAALEVAFEHPERIEGLVLAAPSLAWLCDRRWAPYLRLVPPQLGLLQAAPRPIVERILRRLVREAETPWAETALDEFLRAYLTPRGRVAFYAAARQVYLEEPERFWSRLDDLGPESLFVWGRRDEVVPFGFARHVRAHVPAARHLELDCGHTPQVESPARFHAAIADFLDGVSAPTLAAAA
ncbi:MAG TPA: alpha/beta fold hydrolase [Thermoleophilaceae bacterium]|nr:alpha/beta fold hydrolase [Thermoleophilaceae bacterium]